DGVKANPRATRAYAGPAGQGRSTRGSGVCLELARRRPAGPTPRGRLGGRAASRQAPRKSGNYAYFGPPPFRVPPTLPEGHRQAQEHFRRAPRAELPPGPTRRAATTGAAMPELDSTVWSKRRREAGPGTRSCDLAATG